jgi:two-component system, NtrC family, nitrogen regulation sensor histidine kinase NtrY
VNAAYLRIKQSWFGRNIAVVLTVAAFISAIATYFVITSSEAPLGIKPQRVLRLLVVNILLLTMLVSIIGVRIYNLWSSFRAGGAGSKLQKRILILFSLVAILPTIIVSVFSALFFNLGIQTWFNERVQTAVGESLVVAEAYLSEHKENIRADAIAMADDLNRVANLAISSPAEFERIVVTQSALRVLTEAMVFRGNRIIAQGRFSFALAFERIPQDVIERAARGEVVLLTDSDDRVRAVIKLDALTDTYLLVGRLVDSKVLDHMENAQGAVSEYEDLKSQLGRLQSSFNIMFITLALLLLFSCIWYGMVFAARLSKPLSRLVKAAERVRGGDFSARVTDTASKDEVGMLSRAFNRMTEQLEAQRGELMDANRRLDERRRFSEAVLSGVSAGVIALDRDKRITLSNRSATAILEKVDQSIEAGGNVSEILPGINELLVQSEQMPGETMQATITLNKNGKTISLHVRVTVEKLGSEIEGFIVTFDDITLLVLAQRNAAWADVARRVAHEIKNPLTPIQLAAERLKRKYLKYITEDEETFIKYTDTISKHVGDIGRMVEEFVSFARMPTPRFEDEDIAALLKKAVFSAQVGWSAIDYDTDIPDQPVMFTCDERQITQVMTNLLKNAAEAIEARQARHEGDSSKGRIHVSLNIDKDMLTITIEDNGVGFPQADVQKMLDPYVTTRSKGTGLGLAIVKKIIEDHKGNIDLANISAGGARVILSFPQHCDINASTNLGQEEK